MKKLTILTLLFGVMTLFGQSGPDLQALFNFTGSLHKSNVADIDHDGDLDFIRSMSNPSHITVHKLNLGTSPNFSLAFSLGNWDDADFADVNNDGFKDIVLSSRGSRITYYLNNGSGYFSYGGNITGTQSEMSFTVRAIDVDGDGDDDLVTGTYETAVAANWYAPAEAYIWKNNNGTFTLDQTLVLGGKDRVFDFASADVDGDGDKDLIISIQSGATYSSGKSIWLNDGSGNFSLGNLLGNGFSMYFKYEPGDYDGDGDIDLISAGAGLNYPFGVYMFVNNGSGIFTPQLKSELANNYWFTAGDLDLDGDLDIVASRYAQSHSFFLNDGDGNFQVFKTDQSSYAFGSIISDFDMNSTPDVLTSGYGGKFYSNYTTPLAPVQTLTILGGYGTQGDVDPYTEASRDNGQTWAPAYLTGWHPWGFASGTNSWINFDPSPFVGLNSTTDYRIRFYVPEDYSEPTMNFTIKADNRAWLSINGVYISQFDGQNSGAAGDQVLSQALHPGLNEITIRLQDFGGWVGLNYRIDLAMRSNDSLTIEPPSYTQNNAPVASAGSDVTIDCAVNSALVSLDGSASSDPDEDELTYSWGLNGSVISTDVTFSHSFGGGIHTVVLTVSDGQASSSDEVVVTVNLDTAPPQITAPEAVFVAANTNGGYSGTIGNATAFDSCSAVTITNDAPAVFPLGTTEVTWTAADAAGNSVTATQEVTVTRMQLTIDIHPGSNVNPINMKSKGVIPVAILSTPDFDATTVDAGSVLFEDAPIAHTNAHIEDVDGDGDMDLMMHFRTQQVTIVSGQTSACLTGNTLSGIPVEGCDVIKLVGKFTKEGNGEELTVIPEEYKLEQNFPNPFNPSTMIYFQLPQNQFVMLRIYDILGNLVSELINDNLSAGYHSVSFKADNLPSGIYIYQLHAGEFSQTQRMLLQK